MRVSEDYDDSEYDLNFTLQGFQYGNDMFQTTTNITERQLLKGAM